MSKQKTPVGVIAKYVKDEIPKQISKAVEEIPKAVDGIDGSKGVDGVGITAKVWKKGVYRKDSIVTHHIGQYFKSINDTSDEPGSESKDWKRVGECGFRMSGSFSSESKYVTGDLYVKDFGLFLFANEKSYLVAGRGIKGRVGETGPVGKAGVNGTNGLDGSELISFEINETNLVQIYKNADGSLSPTVLIYLPY